MLKKIALLISVVFHPLFLPTYALALINWLTPYQLAGLDPDAKLKIFIAVIINTIIFPVLIIFIMSRLKMLKNIFIRDREERIIPYVAISLLYFWIFMVIRSLAISEFITAMFLGASLSVFASFFFNLFFKISIHTVGAGVMCMLALQMALIAAYNLELSLIIIVLVAGLIGSARLYLSAHRPFEIFFGYAIGALSMGVAMAMV